MKSINSLPQLYTLINFSTVENILLVGCGGNGGHVAPHLCRFVSVINNSRGGNDKIKLFFADGDSVEQKNLMRQHFISQDVAKKKASVLAERYAAAFGMEISVFDKYLENVKDFSFFDNARMNHQKSDLIIGCVDNNKTREIINEWFTLSPHEDNFHWRARFWIDAGNEEKHGQVVCGYSPASRGSGNSKLVNTYNSDGEYEGEFSLPSVIELYPELLNGNNQFNSELSCAERSESAPQNMQTNVTAATLIMNYVQKAVVGDSIKSHEVKFNIDNMFQTKLNTQSNLSKVSENRRRWWEQKNTD